MIPNSSYQLLVVIALVLPGIVFGATLQRLRGPTPEDKDASTRILRAIAVGAGLDVFYTLIGGPYFVSLIQAPAASAGQVVGLAAHSRLAALWILLLAGIIPAFAAYLVHISAIWRNETDDLPLKGKWERVRKNTYRTTPTAWDYIARSRGECFARIRLSDGNFVGGWVNEKTYVSGYPEPRDIFIASQWKLNSKGDFLHKIEGTLGVYVALPENVIIEWLDRPDPEEEDDGNE